MEQCNKLSINCALVGSLYKIQNKKGGGGNTDLGTLFI